MWAMFLNIIIYKRESTILGTRSFLLQYCFYNASIFDILWATGTVQKTMRTLTRDTFWSKSNSDETQEFQQPFSFIREKRAFTTMLKMHF